MSEDTATSRHVAVVIVGAGPTGLVAANLLGQAGIETLLLERHAGISDIPRAITLDDEGLRICQELGLYEKLSANMLLDVQAHYVSRGCLLARVAPTRHDNGHPFVSTLHQPTFEATLLRGLERFPRVEVRFQHTVTAIEQNEQCVHLTVQCTGDQHITCDYLLACDGGKSMVRQCLDIPMRILSGPFFVPTRGRHARISQHWLVVDGTEAGDEVPERPRRPGRPRTPGRPQGIAPTLDERAREVPSYQCRGDPLWSPSNSSSAYTDTYGGNPLWSPLTITFFCTPARPAVTVPAPEQRRRWEFMLLPGEQEEDVLHQQRIYEMIKQATGQDEMADQTLEHFQVTRQAIYTFHAMLAKDWMRGRVFLLGDAAHLMPPFGGQGMNSGLRDASNLCWKLALVLRGQAHPGVLTTYVQERLPHVAQVIRFSAALGALIMPTNPLIAYARDIFFRAVNLIPPLRRVLAEAQVKPRPRYRRGLLLFTGVYSSVRAAWRTRRRQASSLHTGRPKASFGPPTETAWHKVSRELASRPPVCRDRACLCLLPHIFQLVLLNLMHTLPFCTSNDSGKRLVGTLLPQPRVTLANGGWALLDDILHTRFALLRLTGTPSTAYASLDSQVWQHWSIRFVCIAPQGQTIQDEAMDGSITAPFIVRDDDNVLNSRLFHGNESLCLLVRPDRYIMGTFLIQNSRAFEQALVRLLQPIARPTADDKVPPGV